MKKKNFWDLFFKVVCGFASILFLIAIILKLFTLKLPDVKLEYLLMSFGLVIILPYLSKLDAFGVRLEIKKKVDDLSDQIYALPDYVLGSEYQADDDYTLAEKYYRNSLEKCNEFWPAILGLAGVFVDKCQYDKAIMEYNKVLLINPDNAYAYNNLSMIYLQAEPPIQNPAKAVEMANLALEKVPLLSSALFYNKGGH